MKKRFDKESTRKSNKAISKKLTGALCAEELRFKSNITMKDINLSKADGSTVRMLRRIVEKRVCQNFWNNHRGDTHSEGWRKAKMKREMTRQLEEVCGGYSEYRFAV